MLQSISLSSAGSYGPSPQSLHPLKEVNFIFGANGSGKTTISRVIANPANYTSCQTTWGNGRPLEAFVFNPDFVAENFSSVLPGIFTLGEDATEAIKEIETLKLQREAIEGEITSRKRTLQGDDGNGGKLLEISRLRTQFEIDCWESKKRHDANFQHAFTGVRNDKSKFADKVLHELVSNAGDVKELDDLKKNAAIVFQEGLTSRDTIPLPAFQNLLDLGTSNILEKKIIGKEDIDVSLLIKKLSNSDWVKQGLPYLEESGESCPFCQQKIANGIAKKLDEYFDETYIRDLAEIDRLLAAYNSYADSVLDALDNLLSGKSQFLDIPLLSTEIELFAQKIEVNVQQIEQKRKFPSSIVFLEDLTPSITSITAQISAANKEIEHHNAIVENIGKEKQRTTEQIWRYILDELKAITSTYVEKKKGLDKACAALGDAIKEKERELKEVNKKINAAEGRITSAKPTVTEINKILKSFGFTNFELATTGEREHLYKIVRPNGSDAIATLSEGEKSFVTFLYFYHLLGGSKSGSNVTTDRIAVFDDPISSLDSDVLFIVSTLVRRVISAVKNKTGNIKQVLVLTHNIYFHKEVSFDKKRQSKALSHETFWVVRKGDAESFLVRHDDNPVKTSYEMLWAEVKNPQRSNITIQNTLRRIIENYFKLLGGMDPDSLVEKMEGKDQQLCRSLISWLHDGSHTVGDDLYVSMDETLVQRYLDVFRGIFEINGHIEHYNMMMEIEPRSVAPAPQLKAA